MARKGRLLYEGKGKKVYAAGEGGGADQVILLFKDDLTAWQGKKKSSFPGKGKICRAVSSFVFQHLKEGGIPVHWIRDIGDSESLCRKVHIIPLEAVVRNRLAGSSAKRLGFSEGARIKAPLFEFYWKKDALDDPFVSSEQIIQLGLIEKSCLAGSAHLSARSREKAPAESAAPLTKDRPAAHEGAAAGAALQPRQLLNLIKKRALLINKKLRLFFSKADLELVDFKMEFGMSGGALLLADDISPDSCRLWDLETGCRFDKDRFRHGWGAVEEGYRSIESRLREKWGQNPGKNPGNNKGKKL